MWFTKGYPQSAMMEYLIVDFVSHSDDYIKSLKGSPTALLSDTVRGRIQTTWKNKGGGLVAL